MYILIFISHAFFYDSFLFHVFFFQVTYDLVMESKGARAGHRIPMKILYEGEKLAVSWPPVF